MSTDTQKVNVGLLPEQTEDYSQYEENELNWGRIIPALALVLAIAITAIYFALKTEETPTSKIKAINNTEQNQAKITKSSTTELNEKKVEEPKKIAEPVIKATQPISSQTTQASADKETTTKKVSSPNKEVDVKLVEPAEKVKAQDQLSPSNHHVNKLSSPIKILDRHIKKAQLSSNLIKGMPVDSLSSRVLMSEEGIIRVHLYTEMANLRGLNLYHHWYLNGEKQARVRVPINHNHQRSSSSKFINKQMLGKWTVQVLDEQGKAYIEVNFDVESP
jgi:hypothetical protein